MKCLIEKKDINKNIVAISFALSAENAGDEEILNAFAHNIVPNEVRELHIQVLDGEKLNYINLRNVTNNIIIDKDIEDLLSSCDNTDKE